MSRVDHAGTPFGAVLARAQSGEAEAIASLWRTYAPVVAGYARLEGMPDPDDLTSDVFLGAIRTLGRFRGGEAQFRSWLFTIAYRRVVDVRRRQGRRHIETRSDVDSLGAPGGTAASAEEVALGRAGSERVEELCGRLVPAQREVLVLRLVGGLTIDEVADITERSPGATKALQRRGLSALSRILDREAVPL